MHLWLHIGTEKTGSSYLQTLLGLNRPQLAQAGIHFPNAGKLEQALLNGQISAGNGQDLHGALAAEAYETTRQILTRHYADAQRAGMEQVVISNELLLSVFATASCLSRFLEICRAIGFTEIKLLLVLRDPIDQALSLYKHRAKGGNTPEIEDWVQEKYYYGGWLQDFLAHISQFGVELSVRRYSRKPGLLEGALFVDWLGIDPPAERGKQVVNPSLSLSELFFIRELRRCRPALVDEFYQRMLAIPKAKKVDDHRLESHYRQVLNDYLLQYDAVWQTCNDWLPAGEALQLPEPIAAEARQSSQDKVLVFSEAQAKVMASLMAESLEPKLRWQLRGRKLRKQLSVLKATMLKVVNV